MHDFKRLGTVANHTGGAGADDLTGGAGDDVFTYAATTDGGDTINDFESGTDSVELAATGFNLGTSSSVSAQSTGTITSLISSQSTISSLSFSSASTGTFALLFLDSSGTDAGLYYLQGSIAASGTIGSGDVTSTVTIATTGNANQIAAGDIVLV